MTETTTTELTEAELNEKFRDLYKWPAEVVLVVNNNPENNAQEVDDRYLGIFITMAATLSLGKVVGVFDTPGNTAWMIRYLAAALKEYKYRFASFPASAEVTFTKFTEAAAEHWPDLFKLAKTSRARFRSSISFGGMLPEFNVPVSRILARRSYPLRCNLLRYLHPGLQWTRRSEPLWFRQNATLMELCKNAFLEKYCYKIVR